MSKLVLNEKSVCKECLSKILPADSTRIKYEFQKKFKHKGIIEGFTSLYIFEKDKEIQKIVHALKYGNNFRIGEMMGNLLGYKLLNEIQNINLELIIPVPLHRLKKSERGYNQSSYISKGVNKILKLMSDSRSVKRVKYTETQTSMNILEREKNISGAFKVSNENKISGKNILIIDDVITSGNTVSELGKTLKEKGADIIYAASLAIAD